MERQIIKIDHSNHYLVQLPLLQLIAELGIGPDEGVTMQVGDHTLSFTREGAEQYTLSIDGGSAPLRNLPKE